ncbi:hypothetical protein HA402_003534 [Bradysia odoriphaga]|nr:hypothetical protein HA402_003534 [Bradysia odoriphaga]
MGSSPANITTFWQKTITAIGTCVTFNMYDEREIIRDGVVPNSLDIPTHKTERLWSRDYGYRNNLPLQDYTYPFRSFDIDDSLETALNVEDSKRFFRFNSDILVIFHAPDEAPLYDRHSEVVRIKPGKYNYIEITPHLVVSEGIEHYAPEVRQCYYSNERHLKFYKNYTQNNCESECIVNYTIAQCGCVSYERTHFNDTKLCTTKSEFKCFYAKYSTLFLPSFVDDDEENRIVNCNCLPSCTQLSYNPVHTSSTVKKIDNGSWVYISNRSPYMKKHVRTELHSISEFFSNCGGSLGLFLGMSIFSIMELLYFCTVRLYLHCRRR